MPKRQPLVDIKIQRKVRDALVELCKVEAEKIMGGMHEKNPHWKKGTFTHSNRGSNQFKVRSNMRFGFENNDEVHALEHGKKAIPFTGTFTQNVGEYKRKLKKRSTTVKKHTRTYKNMKPVKLASGEWRILKGIPAQKKKAPLHKGITKLLKNDRFIASALKKLLG
jgi:hypothetical protein